MAPELMKCPSCGKVYAPRAGKYMCAQCAVRRMRIISLVEEAVEKYGKSSPEDVAAFAGVPLHEAKAIINESGFLSSKVNPDLTCVRCKQRPAQPHAEYCLLCRLELNRDLDSARRDLAAKVASNAKRRSEMARGRPTGLTSEMGKKRALAVVRRVDPTPKGRY
ncbi:MAG: hypothetical protein JXR94_01365 [Candidatus Hydrogenedentes bacterium]|nr:hypothetical protein [Candidatus Hydrogenedentota bacterium]